MKKVLTISYYWPPAGGPGSQRVAKFVKYLPEFGWQPHVLTVKNGEYPYIDESLVEDSMAAPYYRTASLEPFQFYKKVTGRKPNETLAVGILTVHSGKPSERIASWVRSNLFVPDARLGWIPFAVRKGLSLIHQHGIDVIFTSSPPHSLQLAGWWLKKMTGLPWVVDLRDPWTDIRYYQFLNRGRTAKKLDNYFERQTLAHADHILTVSHDIVNKLQTKVGNLSVNKFHVIPNGFDESDFAVDVAVNYNHFIILHSGNILDHQNPIVLWKALQQLVAELPAFAKRLKIKFIGRIHPVITQTVKQHRLDHFLETQGFIPHSKIIREMMAAGLLLMVVPHTEDNLGIVTGKLFEYIGSGRPILGIGPINGDAADILRPFPQSTVCNYDDIQSCRAYIVNIFNSWQKKNTAAPSHELMKPYSRRELSRQLASILASTIH